MIASRLESLETRRLLSAGDLDISFGTAGSKPLYPAGGGDTPPIVQPLATGSFLVAHIQEIVRYNGDGSIDTTFGSDGHASAPHLSPDDLQIAPDGKIVVAGTDNINLGGNADIGEEIRRYNADGTPDTTFGNGGTVNLLSLIGPDFTPLAVAPASDGKIALMGYPNVEQGVVAVYRLNADGTKDSTFTPIQLNVEKQTADRPALAVQADGKILIGGQRFSINGNNFTLARLTTTGALDTTFGQGGTVTSGDLGPDSIIVLSDGRIIAVGRQTESGSTAVIRVSSAGVIDNTFGPAGESIGNYFSPIKIQSLPSGNLLLFSKFDIQRLDVNGKLDQTFGRVTTVGTNLDWGGLSVNGVVEQADQSLDVISEGETAVNVYRLQGSGNTPGPISLNAGTLTVTGTSGDDGFEIVDDNGFVHVSVRHGFGRAFAPSDIDAVSITALAGNDFINCRTLDVPCTISGGAGNDKISGGTMDDVIFGNSGRDSIDGSFGDDILRGNGGRDHISDTEGTAQINGGAGDDWLAGNDHSVLDGSDGNDRLTSGHYLYIGHAPNGNWELFGGNNTLRGGAGNDTLVADNEALDLLDGGDGTDTATRPDNDLNADTLVSIEDFLPPFNGQPR